MQRTGVVSFSFLVCALALSGCRGDKLKDESDGEGTPDTSAILFDQSQVRRFDVIIPTDNGPPSSWDLIDDDAQIPGCVAYSRPYHEGGLRADGMTFDGVGIKVKGGCGSTRRLDEKPSLKIHLGWDDDPTDETCPEERRLHSMQRLTLNNGVQDWSAMHEHLSYQFYRMVGVTAPRSASIVVYINDEYYGVYQHIETIDRQFLSRNFDTDLGKGMMYEGSYYCDFLTGEDSEPMDGGCWQREFDLDSCSDTPAPEDDLQFAADGTSAAQPWAPLRQLIADIEAIQEPEDFYPAITELFDWKEFIAGWAASSILWDWDSYYQFQNNFRIYHDVATSKWHFIPWGTDQSWIASQVGDEARIHFGIFEPTGDLGRLCLMSTGTDADGKTCAQVYVEELSRQADLFEAHDWNADIDAWFDRLESHLREDDPHRGYNFRDWEDAVNNVRNFAENRAENVRQEIENEGF